MSEIDVYKEWLGIPEGDRPPDHYTLLRLVQFEDDAEKIQSNYRKLNAHVRKYATGQYLKQSQDLLNEMAKSMLCLTDIDAKREYDISLGREPQGGATDADAETVLQYLVSKDIIKRGQVDEIERFAEARGISNRDAVVQMKLAKPSQATQALAVELRIPFVDLNDMLPEDEILDRVPKQVVKRHTCIPLFEERGKLLVACVDQPSPDLEDEIRMRFGMPMKAVLAVPRSIQKAIAKYYAPGERNEAPDVVAESASGKSGGAKKQKAKKAHSNEPLSEMEKSKRKQISLIIICWSLIGTIVGLNFSGALGTSTFVIVGTGLTVGGVVAGILKLTYWKS